MCLILCCSDAFLSVLHSCSPGPSNNTSCPVNVNGTTIASAVPVSEILATEDSDMYGGYIQELWFNTGALLVYLVLVRILAYLVLRFKYRPNY